MLEAEGERHEMLDQGAHQQRNTLLAAVDAKNSRIFARAALAAAAHEQKRLHVSCLRAGACVPTLLAQAVKDTLHVSCMLVLQALPGLLSITAAFLGAITMPPDRTVRLASQV